MISSIKLSSQNTNYQNDIDCKVTNKTKIPNRNYSRDEYTAIWKEDIYNNYTNWDAVVYMGESPLANSLACRIQEDTESVFMDFYDGKICESDVKNYMKKACDLLIEYSSYCTPEKEITNYEKEETIGGVYEIFEHMNTLAAVYSCEKTGKEYSKQYGNGNSFVYYDSDIYFKWKNFSKTLEESAEEIGQYILDENVDFSKYLGRIYGVNDFNLEWSFQNHEKRLSTMLDCTFEPPQNFKFFYKFTEGNNNNSSKCDCNLIMWLNKEKIETKVPLNMPTAGVLSREGEQTLLGRYSKLLSNDMTISNFLNNIRIFTPYYGIRYYDDICENLVGQMKHNTRGAKNSV